jgi:hypothetical protein
LTPNKYVVDVLVVSFHLRIPDGLRRLPSIPDFQDHDTPLIGSTVSGLRGPKFIKYQPAKATTRTVEEIDRRMEA